MKYCAHIMSLKETVNEVYKLLDIVERYEDKLNLLCVIFKLRPAYLVGDFEDDEIRENQLHQFINSYGDYFQLCERYTQPESMPSVRLIYSRLFNPWIGTYEFDFNTRDEFYGKALGFDCDEPDSKTDRYSINFDIYVDDEPSGLLFNQMCEYGKVNIAHNQQHESEFNNLMSLIDDPKIEIRMELRVFPAFKNKTLISFIKRNIDINTSDEMNDDDYKMFVDYYKLYLLTFNFATSNMSDLIDTINGKEDVFKFIQHYGTLLMFLLIAENDMYEYDDYTFNVIHQITEITTDKLT